MARFAAALLVFAAWAGAAAAKVPEVLVSIAPMHSLIAGIMNGAGAPKLLMAGAIDPHDVALKPSQAGLLATAEAIVWLGPELEIYLEKPLRVLATNARVFSLLDSPGAGPRRHADGTRDPHIWLDSGRAVGALQPFIEYLIATDPANAAIYEANAMHLARRLGVLDGRMATRLNAAVAARKPFAVAHDMVSYLIARVPLNLVGVLSLSPGRPPGARRLARMRQNLEAAGVVCLLAEPDDHSRALADTVAGRGMRIATIDILGRGLEPGPDLYFKMMEKLTADIAACVAD